MDELRIKEAAETIRDRKAALKWLAENASDIDVRGQGVDVSVRLHNGSGLPGAQEAMKRVSAYARFALPDVIETAKRACKNDIDLAMSAIRDEIERATEDAA